MRAVCNPGCARGAPLTPTLSPEGRGGGGPAALLRGFLRDRWLALAWVLVLVCLPASGAGPLRLGPAPGKKVARVVTLAPSLTEVVLALGRGEALVGVSRYDEAPQVAQLPRVGGFVDPSVEAVVALKPDLLLVQPAPGNRRPVELLAELGVPVLALPLHSVEDTLQALREVGRVLGVEAKASSLISDIQATRTRIRAQAGRLTPPSVLFVYGFEPLVVAGPGSFADELLRDAGGRNVAAGAKSPYPVYSLESAVAARPAVVVDASDSAVGREKVKSLPGLSDARWVQVPSKALLQPGPSLGRGLEELFHLLHPAPPPAKKAD